MNKLSETFREQLKVLKETATSNINSMLALVTEDQQESLQENMQKTNCFCASSFNHIVTNVIPFRRFDGELEDFDELLDFMDLIQEIM